MIDGRDGGENGEMDFDSISCVWRNYISLLSTSERERVGVEGEDGSLPEVGLMFIFSLSVAYFLNLISRFVYLIL